MTTSLHLTDEKGPQVPMENVEIERKFLVTGHGWREKARPVPIRQGYLAAGDGIAVRVRQKGDKAYLTVKGARDRTSRYEYEYRIPLSDALEMLDRLCSRPPIEKTRFEVEDNGNLWEIDVFEGANAGLVVAEIELLAPDQVFVRPDWLGPEVTQDARFCNAYLYQNPFSGWGISYQSLLGQEALPG